MSGFNTESRTKNAVRISAVGGLTQVMKVLLGFFYRSLFLRFLTEEYLGINGLFSNILQILSLAELGVTTAIVYRFYEPISRKDTLQVGRLMNFFRRVYLAIAGIILALGLLALPFIQHLIRDSAEVPGDVNLRLVYCLFLANTVSSYLFTYKFSLLTADQKNYYISLIDLAVNLVRYLTQIAVLVLTRNYTLTLVLGIGTTLLINYLFSLWITRQYREVFSVRETLSREERKAIFDDTRACMYHKVGATVLTGTDSAVLTKMVSLAATGLYSNYAMLIMHIQQIAVQLLGSLTASVGSALQNMSRADYHKLFRKMNFLCLWMTNLIVVGCYAAIDDLVCVWLGEKYVFDRSVTLVLCAQLYLTVSRIINNAFINADGLFVRDKIRPLIEAAINLAVSIVLARYIGIAGVFLGTIISSLATIFWREPLLLYRYSFRRGVWDYWRMYGAFAALTALEIAGITLLKTRVFAFGASWPLVVAEGLAAAALVVAVNTLLFCRTEEFRYLKSVSRRLLNGVLRRG